MPPARRGYDMAAVLLIASSTDPDIPSASDAPGVGVAAW